MFNPKKECTSPINLQKSKSLNFRVKNSWFKWLFPITGLIATIWFLIRVIPKPSRATYPCQRVAFSIASSFIVHILGIFATAVAFRKAKKRFHQSRYILATVCILVGIASAWFTISIHSRKAKAAPFVPPDPSNSPMGVAKGIHPGRVVWVHDPNATDWNGSDNYYWDDNHTDQNAVDQMMSTALLWLTEEPKDDDAWDAIFRYFNQTHGKGDVGYQSGEKIVIKPNNNEQRSHPDADNNADMSPQVVLALLKQLVWHAGVDQNCITLCDPSRYIADKTYDKCNDVFPDVLYEETDFYFDYADNPGTEGRVRVVPCDSNLIYYSAPTGTPDENYDRFPTSFINAAYVINLASLKGHINVGVTLCGKNLYGSPSDRNPDKALHLSLPFKNSALGQYRAIVDLMGHEHMGGKTLLYLVEGLWGSRLHKIPPETLSMSPFNDDYSSSLFVSQDPVAIDSVCLDILRTEWADQWEPAGNSVDDYLHEAALANDPCSGTFYDPEDDGTPLASLGVHEHWNNSTDKLYSRNLGIGDGIELVSPYTWTCTELLDGDVNGDCKVDEKDLSTMALNWLTPDANSNEGNLDGEGRIDFTDFDIMGDDWNKSNRSP